jgi:hypothetical protein
VGTDIAFRTDFIWRGLTRVSRTSFQPSLFLGLKRPSWIVTAGAWSSIEPFDPDPTDFGNAGADDGAIGEVDLWAQLDWRFRSFATIDLTLGFTAYTFHGDATQGGRGSEWDTSELYIKGRLPNLSLSGELPLALELSVWKDVGPIEGGYSEAVVEVDLPVLPLGEPLSSVIVRLVSGWSFGQQHRPGSSRGYYDGNGPTHLDFSLAPVLFFRLGTAGLTLHSAVHLQVGFDKATLQRGLEPDDRSRVFPWWELTISVLEPLRPAE